MQKVQMYAFLLKEAKAELKEDQIALIIAQESAIDNAATEEVRIEGLKQLSHDWFNFGEIAISWLLC